MASWKKIAERAENSLSINYETVRTFFNEETKQCNSAIKVNKYDNNTDMVLEWEKHKSTMKRIKTALLNKLIKP